MSKLAGEEQTQADRSKAAYVPLKMTSEYFIDKGDRAEEEDVEMSAEDEDEGEGEDNDLKHLEQVDKEVLTRGFKYGSTYVPCPDGEFQKLPTKAGMEICGFFLKKNVRTILFAVALELIFALSSDENYRWAKSNMSGAILMFP